MARTKRTPTPKPTPPLSIHSLSLTPDTAEALATLTQDASDYIGRTISASALIRALITYAHEQRPDWLTSSLWPLIERELAGGIRWGKKS